MVSVQTFLMIFLDDRLTYCMLPPPTGLMHLHSTGIIHRDIKPPNCMWRREGGSGSSSSSSSGSMMAKLGDFGLCISVRDGDTSVKNRSRSRKIGTDGFWPPEREYSHAGDIYSFGITALCVLSKGRVYDSKSVAKAIRGDILTRVIVNCLEHMFI